MARVLFLSTEDVEDPPPARAGSLVLYWRRGVARFIGRDTAHLLLLLPREESPPAGRGVGGRRVATATASSVLLHSAEEVEERPPVTADTAVITSRGPRHGRDDPAEETEVEWFGECLPRQEATRRPYLELISFFTNDPQFATHLVNGKHKDRRTRLCEVMFERKRLTLT